LRLKICCVGWFYVLNRPFSEIFFAYIQIYQEYILNMMHQLLRQQMKQKRHKITSNYEFHNMVQL